MGDNHAVLRAVAEGVILGVVGIAAILAVGFVFPGAYNHVLAVVVAIVAGLAWAFRPEQRQARYVALVSLAIVAIAIPFLISPSLMAGLLH